MITCHWENGEKALLRHVVVDGLVMKDDTILLCRRASWLLTGAGLWCLPGGYVDRDETVSQAIIREVSEETGYEASIEDFFFLNTDPALSQDRQNIGFIFILTSGHQVREPDHETQEARWFPLDALPPAEEIAFKHEVFIEAYRKYRVEGGTLPLMNL